MKVNIGPYPINRWTTSSINDCWYNWRYQKPDFQVEDEKLGDWLDRLFDKFCIAWQWILDHTINLIIRNRQRRVDVRIDSHDTWNMDNTLAHIILPMLIQLKATKHGSPWVDDEDVPHLVKKTKKSKKSSYKIHAVDIEEEHDNDIHIRWNWVLDEMIWAFEQVVSDNTNSNYYVPYKEGEEVERSCFYNSSTGEKVYLLTEEESREIGRYDRDLHLAYQNRINRGLTFFGKYYQSLWD